MWKTIDVTKSWRYHSNRYSTRYTAKKRKLFLHQREQIECLENYHRSNKQPTSMLASPKLPTQTTNTRIHLFAAFRIDLVWNEVGTFHRAVEIRRFATSEVRSNIGWIQRETLAGFHETISCVKAWSSWISVSVCEFAKIGWNISNLRIVLCMIFMGFLENVQLSLRKEVLRSIVGTG